MRAKMVVQSVTRHANVEVLRMCPVAAKSYPADGSDEDNSYARWSPSGSLELSVANQALWGKFNPGDTYYVDFTPAK